MDLSMNLRVLAVLIVASITFTWLSRRVYARDPDRRRILLGVVTVTLFIIPWWSLGSMWTLPVGVTKPALWLAAPVPWWLTAAWWSIGALLILRTVALVVARRRELDCQAAVSDPLVAARCREVAADLAVTRPVALRQGPLPCASSLGVPLVSLPADVGRWPIATQRAVLAHELAHLKRADDRTLLLVRLLTDWYWWMPWLRRLHGRYLEAMEESCDDLASRVCGGRETYVAGLVDAVRRLQADPLVHDASRTAAVALLGHSHLASRMERLLVAPRPRLDHADGRWTLLAASLTVLVLTAARPAAIVPSRPDANDLGVLRPLGSSTSTAVSGMRVDLRRFLEDRSTGFRRELASSARDPMPVYPARALELGLAGTVTVEVPLRTSGTLVVPAGAPRFSSTDSSGVLTGAVRRALLRSASAGRPYGLPAGDPQIAELRQWGWPTSVPGIGPIPSAQRGGLRLRSVYHFEPGSSAVSRSVSQPTPQPVPQSGEATP